MPCGEYKIDLGCGATCPTDFIGIDKVQIIDGKGWNKVAIVKDFEKIGLPFCDNSTVWIRAYNVLEHIENLEFVLNECWRVLKIGGVLEGIVPVAGNELSFRDPTHKRFFVPASFDYFCGISESDDRLPSHPKHAKYDFLPWIKLEVKLEGTDIIYFKMSPRK